VTCDELYGRLTDYGEGVLDAGVCAEIEQHAAACPDCTALRQDLVDLSRLCREQVPTVMPAEVRLRLEVLLAGEPGAPLPARRK
jgi:hypothetical protein